MTRTRRAAIDQSDFPSDGLYWTDTSNLTLVDDLGNPLPTPIDDFVELDGSFRFGTGGAASVVTLWGKGVVSIGPATEAQKLFMRTLGPGGDLSAFPGDYIARNIGRTATTIDLFYGVQDFERDPITNQFSENEVVPMTTLRWDAEKIIFSDLGIRLDNINGGDGFGIGGTNVVLGNAATFWVQRNGGDGADRFTGTSSAEILTGGGGDDTLDGGGGNDSLAGDAGADRLTGGSGADRFVYNAVTDSTAATPDRITDFATGSDRIVAAGLGATGVAITTAGGITTVTIATPSGNLVITSDRPVAFGDVLLDNPITGGAAGETLTGSVEADLIRGGGGADILAGGRGVDRFIFAPGDSGADVGRSDRLVDFVSGLEKIDLAALGAVTVRIVDTSGDWLLIADGATGRTVIRSATAIAAGDLIGAITIGGSGRSEFLTAQPGLPLDAGAGDDTLSGTEGDDRLFGGDGDDQFSSSPGSDMLDGGAGNDQASLRFDVATNFTLGTDVTVQTESGSTRLISIERVQLYGSAAADTLAGGSGDDDISGGGGNDILMGGGGDDRLYGDDSDILDGGDGTDTAVFSFLFNSVAVNFALGANVVAPTFFGTLTLRNIEAIFVNDSAFDDTITGGAGNDSFEASAGGNDRLFGLGGDDYFNPGSGNDVIDGGEGNDQVVLSFSAATNWTFANGTIVTSSGTKTLINIESAFVSAGSFADNLTGGNGNDQLYGGAGDDTLSGGGGNDILDGDFGTDSIFGGDGDDFIYARFGSDTIDGGPGTDTVRLSFESQGSQQSGGVRLTVSPSFTAKPEYGFDIDTLTIRNVEAVDVLGSFYRDELTGGSGPDSINGNHGNDFIEGRGGNDTLDGGFGFGDTVFFASAVNVDLERGVATGALTGTDRLSGFEIVSTFDGNDTITAGPGFFAPSAPDFIKTATSGNTSFATAMVLDGGFDLRFSREMFNSVHVPHATIRASGGGTIDYYRFSMPLSGNGQFFSLAEFDIDGTSASLDTVIRLYNQNGVELAFNDNGNLDPGSSSGLDSRLVYQFTTRGSYYLSVETPNRQPLPANAGYTLHVSIPGAFVTSVSDLTGVAVLASGGDDVVIDGSGDSVLDGGTGIDLLSYENAPVGVIANLATGTASADGEDRFQGFENLTGSAWGDRLTGDSSDNRLFGGAGDDTLSGGGGNDTVDGGTGIDTAVFSSARSGATITRNGDGTVTVNAGADGTDRLTGIELLQFGDVLFTFSRFENADAPRVNNFTVGAGGWSTQDRFLRQMADVNGDGFADIVGFGQAGTLVALGTAGGTFAAPVVAVANFGVNQGWTSDNIFHRELADVNGDGRDDIVGFGTAGVLVSLAQANGNFAAPTLRSSNFNPANGWASQDGFARTLADVNGDGLADIIGFGTVGTLVALGTAGGSFGPATFALANFGANQGWTSNTRFHREVGDVNGDGRADIVGFGTFGTLVALGQANGTFAAATFALGNFGANQGWTSQDMFTRDLADVNGDGRDDIVGFGVAGTFVAYGQADGLFSTAAFDLRNFGRDQGWNSDNIFHRELADVNGDGRADIVGFGQNGVFAAIAFDGQVI